MERAPSQAFRIGADGGDGGGPGNAVLVERGARPVTTVDQFVEAASATEESPDPGDPAADQLGLGI